MGDEQPSGEGDLPGESAAEQPPRANPGSVADDPSELSVESGRVYHYHFDTDQADPSVEMARVVAELDGRDADSLDAVYTQVDSLVDQLFSEPPAGEADARLEFTYEGYRITLAQNGRATFYPTD